MNETGGQGEPLLPSARKLAGELALSVFQTELCNTLLDRRTAVFDVVHARDKIEILCNAQIFPETESLGHVADFAFDRFALCNHVVTQHLTAAVVRSQ